MFGFNRRRAGLACVVSAWRRPWASVGRRAQRGPWAWSRRRRSCWPRLWEVFFQEMKNRGRKFHGISGNFHFQRKFPFPGWSGARPPTASTGSEAARPAPRRHVPVAVFRALGRTPRSPAPAGRRPWHRYVGVIIPIIRPRAGPTSCTCACSNISES